MAVKNDDAAAPRDAGGTDMRDSRAHRDAARLLSALIQTPDAALDVFRDGRGLDTSWTHEELARVRSTLDALYVALSGSAEADRERVRRALEALNPAGTALTLTPRPPLAPKRAVVTSAPPLPIPSASNPGAAAPTPPIVTQAVVRPAPMPVAASAPLPVAAPAPPVKTNESLAKTAYFEPREAVTESTPFRTSFPTLAGFKRPEQASADARRPALPFGPTPLTQSLAPAAPLDPSRTAVQEELDVSAPELPDLSVEQFASYIAESKAFPERIALVRERYGIANDAMHAALDTAWQRRLAADVNLATRWRSCYQTYLDWLARSNTLP